MKAAVNFMFIAFFLLNGLIVVTSFFSDLPYWNKHSIIFIGFTTVSAAFLGSIAASLYSDELTKERSKEERENVRKENIEIEISKLILLMHKLYILIQNTKSSIDSLAKFNFEGIDNKIEIPSGMEFSVIDERDYIFLVGMNNLLLEELVKIEIERSSVVKLMNRFNDANRDLIVMKGVNSQELYDAQKEICAKYKDQIRHMMLQFLAKTVGVVKSIELHLDKHYGNKLDDKDAELVNRVYVVFGEIEKENQNCNLREIMEQYTVIKD